jgi:hypothetical protein
MMMSGRKKEVAMKAQLLQDLRFFAREQACPHCPRRLTSLDDFSRETPRFCELGCSLFADLRILVDEAAARESDPVIEAEVAHALLQQRIAEGLPSAEEAYELTQVARAALSG